MAFTSANSSEQSQFVQSLFTGICPVKVIAVNPTSAEIADIYGNEDTGTSKQYVTTVDANGKQVQQAVIDVWIKNDELNLITKASFFLRNMVRTSQDGKQQVIDSCGNTAWVTAEQLSKHEIPMSKTGNPINIKSDYRLCANGEEALTDFVRKFLNLKKTQEGCFSKVGQFFKGDFSEIRSAFQLMPENEIKVLLGVRKTDDGKLRQDVYTGSFMHKWATDFQYIKKHLDDDKAAGRYANSTYDVCEVRKFEIQATDFSAAPAPTTGFTGGIPSMTAPMPGAAIPTPNAFQAPSAPSEDLPF